MDNLHSIIKHPKDKLSISCIKVNLCIHFHIKGLQKGGLMTNNQIRFLEHRETNRSNLAREAETHRSNLAQETETNRHNVISEGQNLTQILENVRSNKAREKENTRHNKATEKQSRRELKERRTHNTKTRKENKRHNLATEKLGQGNLIVSQQNAETNKSMAAAAHRQAGAAEQNANSRSKEVEYTNEHNLRADAISDAMREISSKRLDFDERKFATDLEKWFKEYDLDVSKANADASYKEAQIRAQYGKQAASMFNKLMDKLPSIGSFTQPKSSKSSKPNYNKGRKKRYNSTNNKSKGGKNNGKKKK